jgi:hypothetical protein
MKSKRSIAILGFFCVLAFAFSISSTLVAGENDNNPKGHDGTWISVEDSDAEGSGVMSYVTCTSRNNSSGRSYSCTGNMYIPGSMDVPDGWTVPVYVDGFFSGKDIYRERIVAFFRQGGIPFIFAMTGAGRFRDEDSSDFYSIANIYIDFDGNGLPGDLELFIPGDVQHHTVRRIISSFPDIPFPDYPPKP